MRSSDVRTCALGSESGSQAFAGVVAHRTPLLKDMERSARFRAAQGTRRDLPLK